MLLKFLSLLISFLFHVWKRLFHEVVKFLNKSCGLLKSENYLSQNLRLSFHKNILESKTFSCETGLFSHILNELKFYEGRVYVKSLTSRHSITEDQNVTLKTYSSIDEINIFYKGSLKCMSFEIPFYINIVLGNVKIFTLFNITRYGYKSIIDNFYIDNMKFNLSTCNCTLRNTSDYILISGILKIACFLILCLLEFIIIFHLKLKFSSTDFDNIYSNNNYNQNLLDYVERTTKIAIISAPVKSFISVLNDALVENDRKFLIQYFYLLLYHEYPKQGKDVRTIMGFDAHLGPTGDAYLGPSEGAYSGPSGGAHSGPSGDANSGSSGDAPTEASGDDHSVASGDAHSEESGDAHSEESGDAHSEESGDAHSEESGDAHSEASGDAHSEASGDAHSEASGDDHQERSGMV